MNLAIDAARRRVRLDPRDPDFFKDPYRAYAAIREAAPAFFWEDYGFWCFAAPCRRIRASARSPLWPADSARDESRGTGLARAKAAS